MPIVEVLGIALVACGVPVVLLQNYEFGLRIRAQAQTLADPRDGTGAAGGEGHHRAAPRAAAASGRAGRGGSGLN